MRDAERVEAEHRRVGNSYSNRKSCTRNDKTGEPTLVEIRNKQNKKLAPAEQRVCMKEE